MIAKIIIPTHDNDGRSLESEIESTIKSMCSEFGGATVFDARGCWVNNDGKLYDEPVKVIESAAVRDPRTTLDRLAAQLLEETGQEAIYTQAGQDTKIID